MFWDSIVTCGKEMLKDFDIQESGHTHCRVVEDEVNGAEHALAVGEGSMHCHGARPITNPELK